MPNHTEEMTELLGTPPNWITRYGISVVVLALSLVGFMSWFIAYPDVVSAEIVLSSEQPPVAILPKISGKIATWNATEGQNIALNEVIGSLQNTANTADVLLLEQKLAQAQNSEIALNIGSTNLQLGELQAAYSDFRTALDGLVYFRKNDLSPAQSDNIRTQITHYEALILTLKSQVATLKNEVSLAQKNYERNQLLFKDGIVSALEVEQKQQTYLQYQRQAEQTASQLINYDIQIAQLKAQILATTHTAGADNSARSIAAHEAMRRLQAAIAVWKTNYLLLAPATGRLTLPQPIAIGQTVEMSKPLATIVPAAEGIIGRVALAAERSGKVEKGQTVHIKLANFPYQEYGMLTGCVGNIGLVTTEKNYPLQVTFPKGMVSTRHQRLDIKQDMRGTAEIITRKRRLLSRLLDKITVFGGL